jgi:hypothetical protein
MALIALAITITIHPGINPSSAVHTDNRTRAPGEQLYPEPNVTLEFDRERYEADPHPVYGGDTRITGTILCDMPEIVPSNVFCKVKLKAFSTFAQNSEIVERQFHKNDQEMDFRMYVEVLNDLKGDTGIDMDIELTWEYTSTSQASEAPQFYPTEIYIPPYGYINISQAMNYGTIELKVGEWKTVLLRVNNNANMNAVVSISVTRSLPDMEIEFETDSLELNSYQSSDVRMRIRQTSGKGREGSLVLKLTSDSPIDTPEKEFTFPVKSSSSDEDFRFGRTEIIAVSFFAIFLVLMISFILILRRKRENG